MSNEITETLLKIREEIVNKRERSKKYIKEHRTPAEENYIRGKIDAYDTIISDIDIEIGMNTTPTILPQSRKCLSE